MATQREKDESLGLPYREAERFLIDLLIAQKEANGGRLPAGAAGDVAKILNVHRDHVRRLVRQGGAREPQQRGFCADVEEVTRALFATRAKRYLAYERLVDSGFDFGGHPVQLSQFRRAVNRDISAETLAFLASGDAARQSEEPRIMRSYTLPYQDLFLDSQAFAGVVLHSETGEPVRPWVTSVVCATVRAVVGRPVLTLWSPNQFDILEAVARALALDEEWGPWTGKCGVFHWDNLTSNMAFAVTILLGLADIPVQRSWPHMAWHNGPVESYHAIVKETIAAQYPFSTLAQERLDKTPYWPDPSLIPSFEDWAADFIGAVRKYNKTHQPRKLGGKTPLQAWVEAKEKPEPLEERFARLLAVRRRRVTVYRGAITLDSDCYVSSRLGSLSRTDVEVGTPEDHRIDVFDLQGRHICRAVDQRFADADEWSAIGHEREERRRADHQVAEDTLAEMEEALRRRAAATSDARAAETVGDRSGDEEEHA